MPVADMLGPGLAMIANVMTPYRLNLHKLVAAGIPELKLHTLITHGPAEFAWNLELPESIHTCYFGLPGDSPRAWFAKDIEAARHDPARDAKTLEMLCAALERAAPPSTKRKPRPKTAKR